MLPIRSFRTLLLILFSAAVMTAGVPVAITIASIPGGQSFTVGGSGCAAGGYTTPQTLSWTPGSSCSVSFISPGSTSVGTQYVFSGWQDGSTANPRTFVAPSQNTTYTANFTTQYMVTATANPSTGGTVSGGGWYNSGSTANLTATAASGYRALDWSNPTQYVPIATGGSIAFAVNGPQTVVANFVPVLGGGPPGSYSATLIATSAFTVLGTPPFFKEINSYGQVIGIANAPSGFSGFLWTPVGPNGLLGSLTDLGSLSAATSPNTKPGNINDYGQVIGVSNGQNFLWTPTSANATAGSMIGFPTQSGSQYSFVGLNNYGEAAASYSFLWTPATPNGTTGTSTDQLNGVYKINDYGQAIVNPGTTPTQHFLFTPSAPHGLTGTTTQITGPTTQLQDLNYYSTILGYTCNAGLGFGGGGCSQQQTYLWIPSSANAATGTTTEIVRPAGVTGLFGTLLNAFGQVFGSMTMTDGTVAGFLWTPAASNTATGTLTTIPLPAGITAITPSAINGSGQVVGTLTQGSGSAVVTIPFLYAGGTMYDLSALGTQLNRTVPVDINPKGQIVIGPGTGNAGSVYLLTPFLAPSPVKANPQSGSGTTPAMTFTFTDPRGWQDLGVVNVLINNFIDGRSACYLAYSVPLSTLYLVNDAGVAQGPYAGSISQGGTGTIQNSQCMVGLVSALGSGDNLTLTLAMTFTTAFAGNKILYTAARDQSQNNSGWVPLGVWQVTGGTQTTTTAVAGMSPASGTGFGPTPYTFQFSDTKGFADLGVENILINSALDGRHACYLAYARSINWMYIVNGSGTALLPGASLGASGSVGNSQCAVSWGNNVVTTSGNNLSLALNIGFSPGFGPNLIFYLAARDGNEGNNTGWQASGTWVAQ